MKSKVTVDNETKKEGNLQMCHCSEKRIKNAKAELLTLFSLSFESWNSSFLHFLLCFILLIRWVKHIVQCVETVKTKHEKQTYHAQNMVETQRKIGKKTECFFCAIRCSVVQCGK